MPVEVRPTRREALAIRWLITAAKNRNENTMEERLAGELADAVNGRGSAVKKREDTHQDGRRQQGVQPLSLVRSHHGTRIPASALS